MRLWVEVRPSKAIHMPSGDHRGLPARLSNDVSLSGSLPSALHFHISEFPERVDSKAISRPSGEGCGAELSPEAGSNCRILETDPPVLERSARQMTGEECANPDGST